MVKVQMQSRKRLGRKGRREVSRIVSRNIEKEHGRELVRHYHRRRNRWIWFRRDCPIRGWFAIIRIRATKSLARNTVSFSSS